jgi:choline dehydrogenase-like flavoprotein
MSTAPGAAVPVAGVEHDVIVVGSGAGGASVAREMALRGRRVLLLERGVDRRPRDGLRHLAAVGDYEPVGEDIGMARALTTGGTTAFYWGAAAYPPLEAFRAMGIDLTDALGEARRELPLLESAPDRLLSRQALAVRDGAHALGLPWAKTRLMLVDESRCKACVPHEAIWRARSAVDDAVRHGATLLTRAHVRRVLSEGSRAVGVEYEHGSGRRREIRRAYAARVVLSAGALATPKILQDSGVRNVGNRGFYCDPAFVVLGHVKGLNGGEVFQGSMGTNAEDSGLLVGDGCMSRATYRGYMLATRNFRALFSHRSHVAVGVLVRDGMGGTLNPEGLLRKDFNARERQQLDEGEALARRILARAGARGISRGHLSAAHVGGLLQIGEHLDDTLQTELRHLHVCDCSVLPSHIRLPPVLTLVCLGKYLARRLDPGP